MSRVARLRWVYLGGAVVLLEIACRLNLFPHGALVPPSVMALSLYRLLRAGEMDRDIVTTFACVAGAAVAAVAGGLGLGLLLHAAPRARRAAAPLLASYYAIPVFAFYPGLAAVMGLGPWPIIITGCLNSIASMIICTMDALDRFPPVLGKVARMHRLGPFSRIFRVQLPAIAPSLFIGVKLVVTYSFIGVIGAEFLMASAGVGYQIAYAYNEFEVPRMYGLMLLVIIVVSAVNILLHLWERRVLATARPAGHR